MSKFSVITAAQRLMAMDDQVWLRHANPWSVWTRFTTLPLLSVAIWSRQWIGWYALIPTALAILWIWLNPRLFPPVHDHANWASKGVLGERLYLTHARDQLPASHVRAARVLSGLSGAGVPILAYGLAVLDAWATVAGLLLTALPKAWFVDRMVWLYEDMQGHAEMDEPG